MVATKRKNNPQFRPIKKWVGTSKGIKQKVFYIKNEKPYTFKLSDGGKVGVFARTKAEGLKKAIAFGKNLKKRGFQELKVVR